MWPRRVLGAKAFIKLVGGGRLSHLESSCKDGKHRLYFTCYCILSTYHVSRLKRSEINFT